MLPIQQAALDKICLDLCNQFKYKSDNWNTFIISPARKVCHKYVTFERYVRNQLTTAMENNHTSQSSGKRTDIQSGVEGDEGHEDQDSVGTFKPYNQSPDPKLSSHPGITRNAPENPADIEAGNEIPGSSIDPAEALRQARRVVNTGQSSQDDQVEQSTNMEESTGLFARNTQ